MLVSRTLLRVALRAELDCTSIPLQTYHSRVSRIAANPELQSSRKLRKMVLQSVKENFAVEGIHHPFAKGRRMYWPKTMEDLVKYWKKRVAKDRRLRRQKATRAARSRGSLPRG